MTVVPGPVYRAVRERLAHAVPGPLTDALLRQSAITERTMPPAPDACLDGVVALRSRDALAAAVGADAEVRAGVGALWGFAGTLEPAARSALEVVIRRAVDPVRGLATVPMEVFFTPAEARRLTALRAARSVVRPQLLSVTTIVKFTRLCNLRCSYCHDWRAAPDQRMPFETLSALFDRAFTEHRYVRVVWHGGEPMLLGAAGILRVLAAQAWLLPPGVTVANVLQTNGTLLTPDLLRVLTRYRIRTSVSMDGPPEVHDRTRRTAGDRGTAATVRRTLRTLRDHELLGGVLVVVTDAVIAAGARRLVEFFRDEGITRIGLLAARPASRADGTVDGPHLEVARYTAFLLEVDDARRRFAPGLAVRELDAVHDLVAGRPANHCELEGSCLGRYFSVEPDGSVAHCDKYVGDPAYTLGNIRHDDFAGLRGSQRLAGLVSADRARHDRLRGCRWYGLCRGWCPHEAYVARGAAQNDDGCCGLSSLFARISAGTGAPA